MPFQIRIISTTYKMSFKTQDKCLTNEGLKDISENFEFFLKKENKGFETPLRNLFCLKYY